VHPQPLATRVSQRGYPSPQPSLNCSARRKTVLSENDARDLQNLSSALTPPPTTRNPNQPGDEPGKPDEAGPVTHADKSHQASTLRPYEVTVRRWE
jgi:hypothetical protein